MTQPDIEHALQHGTVVLEEYKQDTLWRVRGRDLDLRSIEIVVAVYKDEMTIKVVTVFTVKK